MALIASIDGPNRRIYLGPESISGDVHPIDIYKEMRTLRRTNEELRKFDVFLKAFGNVNKGGGKATERYVQCISGTRIVPFDTTHVLNIVGTIITDDGLEGVYCFDRSPLTSTSQVDINYVPPQVEVITITPPLATGDVNIVSVGGNAVTSPDDFKADLSLVPQEVWEYVSRTIEFTPEQEAKFDQILLDIADEATSIRNTTIATS